ncbi:MAG: hypothetical protein QM742_11475 [Aquabacterium sp.]
MAKSMIRVAVLYALLGIGMGVVMGASHDFTSKGVHVHVNLLGWVSMALMGVIYQVFPAMARSALARWHFWLHNLSLPVMMAGLYFLLHGRPDAEPLVGIGSVGVALGFVCFACNAWLHAGNEAASQPAGGRVSPPAAASAAA